MPNLLIDAPPNETLKERLKIYNFKTIDSFNVFYGEYEGVGYCKVLLIGSRETNDPMVLFITNTIAKEHKLKNKCFDSVESDGFLIFSNIENNIVYDVLPKLHEIHKEIKKDYPECMMNVSLQQEATHKTIEYVKNRKP